MEAVRSLTAALGRAWLEAPAVANPNVLRWTGGSLYLIGGLVVLLGDVWIDVPGANRPGIAVIGIVGAVVGSLVIRYGQSIPRWSYHLLMLAATALITALALFGHDRTATLALGAPYLFVMVNSVLLFPLREAVVQLIIALVASTLVLAHAGATAGEIIVTRGCALGLTAVVGWLARIASAAEQDPLTGLPNRRGLDRRLQGLMRRSERDGTPLSVALLDFDFFKRLNDRAGHVAGDAMLAQCARTWSARLEGDMFLARYGGDAFAVVMPGLALGPAADLADELRTLVPDTVTVSAGVATWRDDDTGSTLVGRADVALFEAKTAGRDQLSAYGDPDRAGSEIETAIADGQMRVHLQPVVQLATGDPVGYEALVRWEHPRRGLLMPDDFIPRAECTGAIHALGAWMLEQGCRLATALPDPTLSIGVNATIPELRRVEYAEEVGRLLDRWDVAGDRLILEVTEGAFDDTDPQVERTLRELRALGVPVAIDDFGSGYSSLRRIESMPVDIIKVDGELVRAIREDSDDAPILEAVQTMGRRLGVRLVAEHVETPHQADVLRRLGYDFGQGYLFGRPAPADTIVGTELPGVESNHRR